MTQLAQTAARSEPTAVRAILLAGASLLSMVALFAGLDGWLAVASLPYPIPGAEVADLAWRIGVRWLVAAAAVALPLVPLSRWRRGAAPRLPALAAGLLAAAAVAALLRDVAPQPVPIHTKAWLGNAALCVGAGWIVGALGALPARVWPSLAALAATALLLGWFQMGVLRPAPAMSGEVWSPPAGQARPSAPDVVLLTIDTCRADALSHAPHPMTADITPTLDAWSTESVVYQTAVAPSPLTGPSHSGLLSGTPPWQSGVLSNGTPLPADLPWVPTLLRDRGFQTGAFVSSAMLAGTLGYARGFQVYDDDLTGETAWRHSTWARFSPPARSRSQRHEAFERPGAETLTRVEHWLDRAAPDRPIFLWVHLYEPHAPYKPEDVYGDAFDDVALDLVHPDEYADHPAPQMKMPDTLAPLSMFLEPTGPERRDSATALLRGDPAPDKRPDRAQGPDRVWRAGRKYLGEVRTADALARRLDEALRERRGHREQRWIIAGDHGESLSEHHEHSSHKQHVYEANVRVPLMIRAAGPASPRGEAVSSVGVAGTLCSLADVPPPSIPCLPGTGADCDAAIPAVPPASMVQGPDHAGKRRALKVSVREDGWKLVTTWERKTAELGWQEWYQLDQDPDEVWPRDPGEIPEAVREDLVGNAAALLSEAVGARGEAAPRLSESTREALRALGYVD